MILRVITLGQPFITKLYIQNMINVNTYRSLKSNTAEQQTEQMNIFPFIKV